MWDNVTGTDSLVRGGVLLVVLQIELIIIYLFPIGWVVVFVREL